MNDDFVNVLNWAILAVQFGMKREAIIDQVRAKIAEGATGAEVSEMCKQRANEELAKLNAVQPS